VLFMLATSGARDLYQRIRPSATDRELLAIARIAALVGAALGLGLTLLHRSVINALGTFYSLLVVTLFVPVLAGVYAPRTSPRQGLASLAGVPVLAVVHLASDGAGYGALTPVVAGVLASALASLAADPQLFTRPPRPT
jgi:Na+/proline symporter